MEAENWELGASAFANATYEHLALAPLGIEFVYRNGHLAEL